MHLVVDEHRAGERRLQPAREPDPLPTAELGRERDPARYRVDDAWRADADRLQAAPVDPGAWRGLRRSRRRRARGECRRSADRARSSGVGRTPITSPVRSATTTSTLFAPMSMPSTWPRSPRKLSRRARGPGRRVAASRPATRSVRYPDSSRSSTAPLTVGLERPVTRASSAREMGPSARIVRSTAAALSRRRSRGEPAGILMRSLTRVSGDVRNLSYQFASVRCALT